MSPSLGNEPFRYLRKRTRGRGSNPSYVFANAEAAALAARLQIQPNYERASLIDALIGSLKTAGVWAKLDALYVMAAADSQAAMRNWIADQYNLTAVSTPVFVADRGYSGEGGPTGSKLSTNFDPSVAVAPKFTLNAASMGTFLRTISTLIGRDIGGAASGLRIRLGTDLHHLNTTVVLSPSVSELPGLASANRPDANNSEFYLNGTLASTAASPAVAVSGTIFILGSDVTASDRQSMAAWVGGSLTGAEHAAFHAALTTYLQRVGAL